MYIGPTSRYVAREKNTAITLLEVSGDFEQHPTPRAFRQKWRRGTLEFGTWQEGTSEYKERSEASGISTHLHFHNRPAY